MNTRYEIILREPPYNKSVTLRATTRNLFPESFTTQYVFDNETPIGDAFRIIRQMHSRDVSVQLIERDIL